MNRKEMRSNYFLALVLSLLAAAPQLLVAQESYGEEYPVDSENTRETITIFTDRNLYSVNESIRFRSFYSRGDSLVEKTWSRVLYVELINPEGIAIANGKYPLDDAGSSGSLAIPPDAVNGNYLLRSYTKWMRNYGPGSYCYVPVKIINPFTREVFEYRNDELPAIKNLNVQNNELIKCKTSQVNYLPGEEVNLDLILSGANNLSPESYCVTVFPEGSGDTIPSSISVKTTDQGDDFRFDHLPEIRGISISGKVINETDQSPASNAIIYCCIMDDQPGYFPILADKSGRFIMNLPDITGMYELFIASKSGEDNNQIVKVDQDFVTDPVPFSLQPFTLSEKEEKVANDIAINMQLSRIYGIDKQGKITVKDTNTWIPFYGKPAVTLLIEDYVDLPTMTEVFENLVTEVVVYYRRDEPFLQIKSRNLNISYYEPLLLVDSIPVFDLTTFLSIDPLKVEKIEVVPEIFIRGNMKWGGIIKLTSKKEDRVTVSPPEGSYFVNYQAFYAGNDLSNSMRGGTGDRLPDTRNTIYWINNLALNNNEIKTLSFTAPSASGVYHILVRGVSEDGIISFGSGRFEVRF